MAAIASSAAGLAQVLGVDIEGRPSADIIREIAAKADELLRQLPDDFTQPLLSRDSLSEQQVLHSHAEMQKCRVTHTAQSLTNPHCSQPD